jgi:phospholipid/cholesterol/gamma-HCH transport system permease protein
MSNGLPRLAAAARDAMTNGLSAPVAGPPAPAPLACGAALSSAADGGRVLALSGAWVKAADRPAATSVSAALKAAPAAGRVCLDDRGLTQWDSSLLAFLLRLRADCRAAGIEMDAGNLRPGLQTLLRLATAVPERDPRRQEPDDTTAVHQLGHLTIEQGQRAMAGVSFLGECALALASACRGRAQFRWSDVLRLVYACGPEALGIISLIAFLVGLILAFMGAIELRLFGAQIYIADMVAIGMIRELGAVMTGVVMAGRSGAAFAAEIGTMQVNDEIDAFRTMGINPVEFLVLPRLLALTLMMPLLCLYADAMGLLGGGVVGVGLFDLDLVRYANQTRAALKLNHLAVGIVMGTVFGVLVALAGCWRGMQCGRSSLEVGRAATRAVVTSMVWIVVATAIITVICDVLGV